MDNPSRPRKPQKTVTGKPFQIRRPSTMDSIFSLPQPKFTMDTMFPRPQAKAPMGNSFLEPGEIPEEVMDNPFLPRREGPNDPFQSRREGHGAKASFQPHREEPSDALQSRREGQGANNPFQPRRQEPPIIMTDHPFQTRSLQTAEPNNPLKPHRHVEPAPTRHKRYSDKLTRNPANQLCDDCSRKDRVAKGYWERNKGLEEKVEEQAEFIAKLKGQRKELEGQMGILLGRIERLERERGM